MLTPYRTESNIADSDLDDDTEEETVEEVNFDVDVTTVHLEEESPKQPPPTKKTKIAFEDKLMKMLEQSRVEDSVSPFLMSLAPQIRALTKEQQNNLYIEFLNCINKVQSTSNRSDQFHDSHLTFPNSNLLHRPYFNQHVSSFISQVSEQPPLSTQTNSPMINRNYINPIYYPLSLSSVSFPASKSFPVNYSALTLQPNSSDTLHQPHYSQPSSSAFITRVFKPPSPSTETSSHLLKTSHIDPVYYPQDEALSSDHSPALTSTPNSFYNL